MRMLKIELTSGETKYVMTSKIENLPLFSISLEKIKKTPILKISGGEKIQQNDIKDVSFC